MAKKRKNRVSIAGRQWCASGAANRKHGVAGLIANGTLPAGSEATMRRADRLIAKAARELRQRAPLTARQSMLLESTRIALRVVMLGSDYIAATGLLDAKTGRPHALLDTAVSFINAIRLNVARLGLSDSVAPKSVDDILAAVARETEGHDA